VCKWHSRVQGKVWFASRQHNLMTQVASGPQQKSTVSGNKLLMTAAVLFLMVAAT